MQLKIDPNANYALALEGGGAKGAYQIGAWRALREAGIRISAVSGTSVGAMNGALIAMGDLEKAEGVWRDIRYSKVMDVDDEAMRKLVRGDLRGLDLREAAEQFRQVVRNRGFDVTPLYNWMKDVVSEKAVRESDTEFYIVTYSLTDQKELELRARDLPDGALIDMLLASAYLPVFRNEKLGGKRYADGGVRDVLPLHVLLENGYRDIIALRLYGIGVERPLRIPHTAHIHTIEPVADLGGTLDFTPEQSRKNLLVGYYDTQRFLYGLKGKQWYIDSRWTEDEAYSFLCARLKRQLTAAGETVTRRRLHETVLPALARKLDAPRGGYNELAVAWLEAAAEASALDRWHVYTETELAAALGDGQDPAVCKAVLDELLTPRRLAGLPGGTTRSGEKELNVCLMNDSFPPVIDGVANAVQNYAQVITAELGRCAVVTPEYPDAVDDYPYPVIRFPSVNTGKLTSGYRTGNPLSPATISRLSGMGFGLIHTHCPMMSAILARSLREVIDVPLVFTYHTKYDVDIAKAIRGELLQSTAIKLLVSNIAACDDVWVVSRGAGENLRGLGYQGSYTVMPNGVDLPRGRVGDGALRAMSGEWDLPEGVPVYLFIGRIMWYKGLRLLADGLAKLRAAGRDFRMVFIGDGQDRPEVTKYLRGLGLEDRCIFTGAIRDRETVRAWYCRADLLLFPSTFDTNGLVVREAAACGLASLLIRGSCAAEGIEDGRTGILIDESAEALFGALTAPGMDRETFGRIGQTAMDEIYLSWEDSVRAAWARYQTVLELWRKGELRRKKAPFDGLFDKSGDMMETLGLARTQSREALSQLNRELGRARGSMDRYL